MRTKILLITLFVSLILTPVMINVVKLKAETPPKKLVIELPELKIDKVEGYDVVSIENCHFTREINKPKLPYIIYSQNYPRNYKVQNVIMKDRTDLENLTGLNIPDNVAFPNGLNPPSTSHDETGWYPDMDYNWHVVENPDGSTTLVISIFPFFYNKETKEAKYYRKFEFQVDYIFSPVKINYLHLKKPSYKINEDIEAEIEVENGDEEAKDLIVSSLIRTDDGKIVKSFDLQELKALKGKGKLNLKWKNEDEISGDFLFEVSVKDMEGTVYDTTSVSFSVGLPLIEITEFSFDKSFFKPGDELNLTLKFVNKGGKETSGTVDINIYNEDGTIKEIKKEFSDLGKGDEYTLKEKWDTKNTAKGKNYNALATVYYYGTSTQKLITITTNNDPVASFTYTPSSPTLKDEIRFDASTSSDPDNNIEKYEWDFGDGWKGEGKVVMHKYEKAGKYYVALTVIDSAGAESKTTKEIEVLEAVQKIIIRLYIGKTYYYVNDERKTMDVAPIIREGRTLLPIRYVAEALGADVGWNGEEQKVTITFKGTTIELWIGKNTARVNGEYKLIDPQNPNVKPIIIPPGRTMLPIRFIAENLGCKVDWNGELREVKITYPG